MSDKKFLSKIYFDEHVHKSVVDSFRDQKFVCLLISCTIRYKGKDEKEYISKLFSEGAIFVTADSEFVDYVIEGNLKHAGIILLPTKWEDEALGFASAGLAGYIRGWIEKSGRRSLNDKIFYIADTGFHLIDHGTDQLVYSIDRMEMDVEDYLRRQK